VPPLSLTRFVLTESRPAWSRVHDAVMSRSPRPINGKSLRRHNRTEGFVNSGKLLLQRERAMPLY